jgi:hypothetical protein
MAGPWPDKERKVRETPGNERPCLHEDVITQFNNQTINQLEMNPQGIDVQPEGDGADEKTAEFVENRIRQIEYEQNGQHAYLTAGATAVNCSLGNWELATDYASPFSWEKVIKIISIQDPKTVLIDPLAKKPDWSDMAGAFKTSRLGHDEFRDKYPNAQVKSFEGFLGNGEYTNWIDAKTVQIAEFWEVTKKSGKLLLLDDGTDEGWSIFEYEGKIYDARNEEDALNYPLPMLKRKGKAVHIAADVFPEYQDGRSFPIIKESKRQVPKVVKCTTNGIEVLDELDWDDEEIPIMVVTGRVKYENGQRVIDSQTRKARTGQLLYDLCISSIQEETARVPKFLWLGYEGQFDTSTDWKRVHREPAAFGEVKAFTEDAGGAQDPLPHPELVRAEPQIAALLELKQSLMISIQNALGISSSERKDKAAKSGKALQELQDDMNVGTYHYHNSLRNQQLRQYRIINRLLPKIENTQREVGLRDVKGNYSTQQIQANHYSQLGRHEVVISSAKYYQSLQEEQSDFAESMLSSIKDPTIMLAVLPDLIRMKGLGPYGDDLAKMVEAMQPPQMQQARQGQDQNVSPAMLQAMQQQAGMALKALNAHAEQLTQERDQLLFDKKAETQKLTAQKDIETLKLQKDIDVAVINASVKESIENINQQLGAIQHISGMLMDKFSLDHEATQNELDRQHEQGLAAQQGQQDANQNALDRNHEQQMQITHRYNPEADQVEEVGGGA